MLQLDRRPVDDGRTLGTSHDAFHRLRIQLPLRAGPSLGGQVCLDQARRCVVAAGVVTTRRQQQRLNVESLLPGAACRFLLVVLPPGGAKVRVTTS